MNAILMFTGVAKVFIGKIFSSASNYCWYEASPLAQQYLSLGWVLSGKDIYNPTLLDKIIISETQRANLTIRH
jgi:hypothetical protein